MYVRFELSGCLLPLKFDLIFRTMATFFKVPSFVIPEQLLKGRFLVIFMRLGTRIKCR